MTQFKKKPVVIDAFQMTQARRFDNSEWPEWLNAAWNSGVVSPIENSDMLCVRTLEGSLAISWDDWIIRGVAGELYPCKPDIFAATYGEVSDCYVTPSNVERAIMAEHYFTAHDGRMGAIAYVGCELPQVGDTDLFPLKMLTFCVLVCHNGHTVTGESHCQNPAKFNAQTGREEARKDAVNKLWPMLVFAQRDNNTSGKVPHWS